MLKAYMNSDITLETAAIFLPANLSKTVLARCMSWLMSFPWALSTCEEREPIARITK